MAKGLPTRTITLVSALRYTARVGIFIHHHFSLCMFVRHPSNCVYVYRQSEPRYEVSRDVRGQLRFLEELDKLERKRHEETEREMLLRAAKSRSKTEDPEQAKLKAKAKEVSAEESVM